MASAEYQRRWKAAHPEKQREYSRRWQQKNGERARQLSRDRAARERVQHPERVRERKKRNANPEYERARSRRRQGLPEPTRPEPEWCECCGRLPGTALSLDHDHVTGKFRGWLCAYCNLGLGKLGDNRAGLERALAYLDRVTDGV